MQQQPESTVGISPLNTKQKKQPKPGSPAVNLKYRGEKTREKRLHPSYDTQPKQFSFILLHVTMLRVVLQIKVLPPGIPSEVAARPADTPGRAALSSRTCHETVRSSTPTSPRHNTIPQPDGTLLC